MTEPEVRAVIDRVPAELRRLFLWLATGKDAAVAAADAARAGRPSAWPSATRTEARP